MTFPDCFQLAVAATISLSAMSVSPQSTRAAEMDSGTTITSLTSMHGSRHPVPPFGAIDATANDSVMLDISVAPDLTSADNLNQAQAGTGSGHSRLSGSIPSQPGTLSSLPGASSQALNGGSLRSRRGVSLDSLQSASSRVRHAPVVGNIPQTGSNPNALPASNGSGLQPYGQVHPGRDFSGSYRPTPDLNSAHPYRSISGDASAHSSHSDQSDSDSNQSASDVSSEDADTLNVDASTSESSTTAADRQGAQGLFEVIGDPFGNLFQGGFAGIGKGFSSNRSESGSSIHSSQRGALEVSGKGTNSLLHHKNGRLSNDAPGSGSQAQRRLNESNEIEHGSSDSRVQRRSPN